MSLVSAISDLASRIATEFKDIRSALGNRVFYGDVLMPTNPFGGKAVYVNYLENAFWLADERWTVTGERFSQADDSSLGPETGVRYLFDPSYEVTLKIAAGEYVKVTVDFGRTFPGYPYGTFFISCYHNRPITSARYQAFTKWYDPVGEWRGEAFVPSQAGTSGLIWQAGNIPYHSEIIEFYFYGAPPGSTDETWVSALDWQLSRPGTGENFAVVLKNVASDMYAAMRWKSGEATVAAIEENGSADFAVLTEAGTPVVTDDDARLSDARTPTTHGHTADDVSPTASRLWVPAVGAANQVLKIIGGVPTWSTDANTTYAVPSQAEAEAGTATTARAFSAQRVAQAIAALAPVKSVAGKIGTVVLGKADVGLANVDNTSDVAKPVSTATQTALNAKSDTGHTHAAAEHTHDEYAPVAHTHPVSAIDQLQGILDGKADDAHSHLWADITDKPPTFPPNVHTHPISAVENLQSVLDGKASSSHTHSGYASSSHTHPNGDLPNEIDINKLILRSSTDATTGAGNDPALRIGNLDGTHIRMDNNEIIAMTGNTGIGTLILNSAGGVNLGGRAIERIDFGTTAAYTDGNGYASIPHNLNRSPIMVLLQVSSHYGTPTFAVQRPSGNQNVNMALYTHTGDAVTNNVRTVSWLAIA